MTTSASDWCIIVRAKACKVAHRQRALDRARDELNQVIGWALADKVPTRQLAEAARVSQPRIVQIGQGK